MPDVTGLPALDVAIGLAFVYFVLSIVCSAVNEAIAATFRLRARDLEKGIRSMLASDKDAAKSKKILGDLYANPRIQALSKRVRVPKLPDRKPSYIPPRTFVLALLDTINEPVEGEASRSLLVRAREAVEDLPADAPLRALLLDAINDARGGVDEVRKSLERSFDEVMDRVSGWYKRRVQTILFFIALAIVGAANVDTFAIGERLYQDEAIRSAVVAAALEQVSTADEAAGNGERPGAEDTPSTGETPASEGEEQAGDEEEAGDTEAAEGGDETACPEDLQDAGLDTVAKCVEDLSELGLPLGWSEATKPKSPEESAFKALGLLITAFALSLGAPFWFDALGKLARLRGTGNREGTAKDDGRAPSDRDERTPG